MTDMQSYPEPGGDLGHDVAPPPPKPAPRPRRSRQDRVLGGACGGFAHYLNIDPIAVRIITSYASMPRRRSRAGSASLRRSVRGSRCR